MDEKKEESAPASPQPEQSKPSGGGSSNKTVMAVIAYIIFFIPLLTEDKNDPFVKYHVKQGLALFLLSVAVSIVDRVVPGIGWMIASAGGLLVFILWIMGIMNAVNGQQKPLPIIGGIGESFKF